MQTTAINPYHSFEEYTAIIPANVRWAHIRDGLSRAIELSRFTLRSAAEQRGKRAGANVCMLMSYEVADLDTGHAALFGWIPPTFEGSMS